jgi:hypothetical protein
MRRIERLLAAMSQEHNLARWHAAPQSPHGFATTAGETLPVRAAHESEEVSWRIGLLLWRTPCIA